MLRMTRSITLFTRRSALWRAVSFGDSRLNTRILNRSYRGTEVVQPVFANRSNQVNLPRRLAVKIANRVDRIATPRHNTRCNVLYKFCFAVIVFALGVSPLMAQSRTQEGAVVGGVAGAILGGIAGSNSDKTGEGIAIGGAVGALAGGLMGRAEDDQIVRNYQYQQYVQQQRAQQISQAVSINDAITMTRGGLSPNLIVSQIRNSGVQQKIGVKEVIALHENGVAEIVIQEMQNARIAGTDSPVCVARTPAVVVERRPQIVIDSFPVYRSYHRPPPRHAHFYYHGHRHRYR